MFDVLPLLNLTADLHAASRERTRWPAAWAALCRWLECPDVFGSGDTLPPAERPAEVELQILSTRETARHCAKEALGRCGRGPLADEVKRRACLTLVGHLDLALDGGGPNRGPSAHLAKALDALSVPMIWCGLSGQLLHANSAASEELAQARWLALREGQLRASDADLDRRLALAIFQLSARTSDNDPSQAIRIAAPGAEIGLRRLGDAEGFRETVLLVTVLAHDNAARRVERRDWPPRQRELAALLLSGHTLDSAAQAMGIARTTAIVHLKGLFRATGTRRQQDLIRHLSLDLFG